MLSTYALKLLAWFRIYKIQPTEYNNDLSSHPHALRHGVFKTCLTELVAYETNYGYITL